MYSTKSQVPKKAEGYISVGDPYVKKEGRPARFQGKQFSVPAPKRKDGGQGYFSRPEYKPDGFTDRTTFLKTQPLAERKLGFGTRDAFKTSEFTNTVRTEQYREQLKVEDTQVQDSIEKTLERSKSFLEKSAGRRAIFKTSSSSYGYKCEDVEKADKAEHGTVNVTAEFYDKAHLS